MGWLRRWKADRELKSETRLWQVIHLLEHTTRELRMATKETLDALAAAADQLDKSRAASVAATEKLLAAVAAQPPVATPDDETILGVVAEIKSQTDALDAETAKAEAAVASTPTS